MGKDLTMSINGKTYTAPKPKVKLWRQIAKFKEVYEGQDVTQAFDETLNLICATFNHPDITPEALEEHLDLDEVIPMFHRIVKWVNDIFNSKAPQLPNETTPTAD